MAKQNSASESEQIGADLCNLASLLITEGICNDASPLDNAGSTCAKKSAANNWNYSFNKLNFCVDEVSGIIPVGACDIALSFSITIDGTHNNTSPIVDPLSQLLFDLEISGWYFDTRDDEVKEIFCAWHFDRHISQPGDGVTKYSHPLYHFSFGGKKMEEKGFDFGATLILPSPRFAYPPMDAVLGIDFIIKNYLHKNKIKKLITNPDYVAIVKRSQERLWLPYARSFYSYWDTLGQTFDDTFNHKAIFPLYA